MGRLFAIGDVHGCADELAALLAAIRPSAGDTLVFLGDYVDRGPASRDVVDRLIDLRSSPDLALVFLKGNHEDMFLSWLGEQGSHGDAFLLNGGRATLASYGIEPQRSGADLRDRLPAAHLDFLRGLALYDLRPPLLFVHAGIAPLRPLEMQDPEDLLWIREEFVRNRHLLPHAVVFGHTPQRDVLWHLPFKIGLDTGCVYGNRLSCLEFSESRLWQVERRSRAVRSRLVAEELQGIPGLKAPRLGV